MQGSIGFTGTLSGQIEDSGSGGTSNYNELTNKPSINSVPLVGNKTTEDLHLFSGDYDDLSDKPSVNGITLSGNKTTQDLGLFSGNYNDLTNKPNLFSGDYNDLTNKPTLFSGDYNDLTNKPTLFNGNYDSLSNRPTINNVVLTGNKTTADLGLFSGNYNDLTNKPTLFDGDYDSLSSRPQINGNLLTGNKTTADLGLFSGNYNDLTNKPTLFSGNYNDLTNKPYIPDIDMTPAGAATEEVDKIELDSTVYEVKDAAARSIIGDGQLDPGFTATDLTGAANELKSNLDDKLGWYRPDSTVDTLAKFCSYIDNLLGSGSGYRTGYIGSTVAQRIGLSNEGYYYEAKANSENYRIVIVNNASGSLYKTLAKAGGTWQTAWKGVTLS